MTFSLGCPKDDWVGDGFCDDLTNIEACVFDDGDCCKPDRNTEYCEECICWDDVHFK